jgi:RimJ/RimL family protein N-acetyltransferase
MSNIPLLFRCSDTCAFRKLDELDLPYLTAIKAETWQDTHNATIANADNQRAWLLSLVSDVNMPKTLFLTFVQIKGKRVYGFYKITNIDYINRTADVGWDLVKSARGAGLGSVLVREGAAFCFEVLNLRRLTAEILTGNKASQRCAEKAGFIVEGVKRQAVYLRGVGTVEAYAGSQVWGLLRDEFELPAELIDRASTPEEC